MSEKQYRPAKAIFGPGACRRELWRVIDDCNRSGRGFWGAICRRTLGIRKRPARWNECVES